jgi:hypothetical protein
MIDKRQPKTLWLRPGLSCGEWVKIGSKRWPGGPQGCSANLEAVRRNAEATRKALLDSRPVFLVLLDISGYTRFTVAHRASSLHAEKIISELIESVIATSSHPLVVHELLGDEVTFFVASEGAPEIAIDIRRQVAAIFEAFRHREAQLVSECSLCNCEACATVGRLRLKAIVHFGQAVFSRVGRFEKIAGEDVILAHRLLKNSIGAQEYMLETEGFYRIAGPPQYGDPEARTEHPEGLDPISVRVTYPSAEESAVATIPVSILRKLWRHLAIDAYRVARLLGKARRSFHNLEPPEKKGVPPNN